MSKILVTGGAGFIGSHLVDELLTRGHRVMVVDNLSTGQRKNLSQDAELVMEDIRSPRMRDLFRDFHPEYVFHTAAQVNLRKSLQEPALDADVNIHGSLNIIEQALRFGIKKFIFSSTGGAMYGASKVKATEKDVARPQSPYGIAKLTIERYLECFGELYKFPWIALRYANVYGPRQNAAGEAGVVAIFADRIFTGQPLIINGKGDQTRDYVFVADVVAANMAAMASKQTGVFNISTAKQLSVNTLTQIMIDHYGRRVARRKGPAIKGEAQKISLNWNKAKKHLHWRPEVQVKDGVKRTMDWVREEAR